MTLSLPYRVVGNVPCSRPKTQAGFALLVTITLVAFLVLILVALASFTRIETQVASNSQENAQARQNALLALNIAVGQLQKYAGPDQRVTARADINTDVFIDPEDLTQGLDPKMNSRWIGVYGSRVRASYTDDPITIADTIENALGSDPLAAKGSQAILLNWLVSGNEHTAFDPSADVATDGYITLPTAPTTEHSPTDTPLGANPVANVALMPASTDEHVLLVGDASVSDAQDKVSAPLVQIEIAENNIPGFDASSTTPRAVGRYAWWVGDEGTKAHVNLAPDSTQPPLSFDNPKHAFVIAQRNAVELVDAINPTGATVPFDPAHLVGATPAAYDPTQTKINQVLSLQQLTALDSTVWDQARKRRFHDLTAASYSLLTDTYVGGLKQDLSTMLAAGTTTPAGNAPLIVTAPGDTRPYANTPTWGQLRSFLAPQRNEEGELLPRVPREDQTGLSPVMTYSSLKLEWFGAPGDTFKIAIFPEVILWNPYTEPLAPADYEFGFSAGSDRFRLLKKPDTEPPDSDAHWANWENVETDQSGYRSIQHALEFGVAHAAHYHMRFIIRVVEPIPPGESHVFAFPTGHASAWSRPMGGQSPRDPSDTLVKRTSNAPGYAYFDTGVVRNPTLEYAIGVQGSFDQSGEPIDNPGPFGGHAWAFLGERNASINASVQPVLQGLNYATTDHKWPPQNETGNPLWYTGMRSVRLTGSHTIERGILQENGAIHATPSGPETNSWGSSIYYHFDNSNNVRHLVAMNPRAPVFEYNPILRSRPFATHYASVGNYPDPEITSDGKTSANMYFTIPTGGPSNLILFENPLPNQPLLSIGQLQHANLGYIHRSGGYLIGNSAAPSWGTALDRARLHFEDQGNITYDGVVFRYDWSYLLNRSLWDRYFVSTLPSIGPIPNILPNARMIRSYGAEASDLLNPRKVAAHLFLKGGFNINSTSEQAWRAILAGANQLVIPPDSDSGFVGTEEGTTDGPGAAFPRFSRPPAALPSTNTPNWAFTGYRRLDETQIALLSHKIVEHVRDRGPFISLADFINRRLSESITSDHAFKGVIQNAIDGTGSTINKNIAPFNALVASGTSNVVGGDQYARWGGATRAAPHSATHSHAPQFLTQADVLSFIGAGLSARSDTFIIRTYGDVKNPVTGEIQGRAWCEAVVQRITEPLRRKTNDSNDPDYNEPAAGTASAPDFGRRFQITSFRWLSSNDI